VKSGITAAFALAILIAGPTMSVSVEAADAARPLVVSVDMRAAMMRATESKAKIDALKGSLSAEQKQFEQGRDALMKLDEQYKKDSAVMSADQRRSLEKQIEDKRIDLGFRQKKLQKAQQDGLQEVSTAMLPKFEKALKALVDENKYDIIIHREATIYASPQFDITEAVVTKMNAIK
jgi:outer membrane protein